MGPNKLQVCGTSFNHERINSTIIHRRLMNVSHTMIENMCRRMIMNGITDKYVKQEDYT